MAGNAENRAERKLFFMKGLLKRSGEGNNLKNLRGLKGLKGITAVFLVLALTFSLAGCGKGSSGETGEQSGQQGQEVGIGGYIYVPQYMPLNISGNLRSAQLGGDQVYFSVYQWDEETYESRTDYYRMKVGTSEPEQIPLEYDDKNGNFDVMTYVADADGNLYLLFRDYSARTEPQSSAGEPSMDFYLGKYDPSGKELFLVNITKDIGENDGYIYIDQMLIDGQKHLYLSRDESVYLFDENGAAQGVIELGGYSNCFGTGKDGNVYCYLYDRQNGGYRLCLLDYASKQVGQTYQNVPDIYRDFIPGLEKDFLMYDEIGVYEYDLASQSGEMLLKWLDCDIYGSNVVGIAPLEDGRLMVLAQSDSEDDESGESSLDLAFLTKTPVSEVEQKEIITVGSFYQDNGFLQNVAVRFNKMNPAYHISLKYYFDPNTGYSEESLQDAIKVMNAEIISGKGPDVLAVDGYSVDVSSLAQRGAIQDLTPYLEKSDKVHKEDYLESVIQAFTYDGVLTCIPTNFDIHTVAGRSSQVGDKMGWSLDDMIALMDANPDAVPFEYTQKAEMLQVCIAFNQSAFVDYAQGTCSFDSEEFKKILEFVNRFPSEYDGSDDRNELEKIRDGAVLLHEVDLYQPDSITETPQFYDGDDITYVGFPTLDGSVGCMMQVQDSSAYAILSASSHKEGAWAFLEYILQRKASDRYGSGFSSNKAVLESQLSEASAHPYEVDENGQVVLDESGEPVRANYGWMSWDDGADKIYSYAPLPEEVDTLRELIAVARPISLGDTEILSMITEEAEPYFQGQKTVDEVADIIQGRVKIYISENY